MPHSAENFGKIERKRDLDQDPEIYHAEFAKGLETMAGEVNASLGLGSKDKLLTGTGAIRMENFYDKATVDKHRERMKKKQDQWIRRDLNIPHTAQVTSADITKWENSASIAKRKSELLEMVTTVLLHKVLKDDYVIARASKYDDYFGFDNIIVNKKTGAVVCTFDDVHDQSYGNTIQEKSHELEKSAKHGGATIEYGFTFADGKLIKKRIENVPKLFNPFDINELNAAIMTVDPKNLDTVSEGERIIYNSIIDKFMALIPQLQANAQGGEYRKNLDEFAAVLPTLKR